MIRFRTATLPELTTFLDWATSEGWNPGIDDAAAFHQADPDGFFVAEDASGDLLAAISVVNHSDNYAFLGLYIVRPECRGKGIGLALWQHALKRAEGRTIGLDGVEAQQQNYTESGFAHAGGTTRFTGFIQGTGDADIRPAAPDDVSWMVEAEAAASGVAKPKYLQAWFTPTDTRTSLVLEESGAFCTVRQCQSGSKIGPLISDSSADAHRLIVHATSIFDGPVTLDVPETSFGLRGLCEQLELEAGFKTARMYRGPFSPTSHRHFAVTSLELG